jgi:hypothetical protein
MPFGLGPWGWIIGPYYGGYLYWRCRWFPWLPRWWWTGIYGPLTPFPYPGTYPTFPYWPYSKEEEIAALEYQAKDLERQLEFIRKRLEELKRQT